MQFTDLTVLDRVVIALDAACFVAVVVLSLRALYLMVRYGNK